MRERKRMEQEALLQAINSLQVCEARRIVIELLEKNVVVKEWFFAPYMRPGNQLELAIISDIIKTDSLSSLQGSIGCLISEHDLIKERLKKKLLVEQKDGTFAIRKLEPDAI